MEVVTGKRWRGHGDADPGSHQPMCLFRYSWDRKSQKFQRDTIAFDDGVATGMQIRVADLDRDGKSDIAVAGKTFRYTEKGPEGLAGGRRVIVAYASGGFHSGPEEDFVDPYLRSLFRLLGIKDIDVVRAEGVNMSEDHRARAMQAAKAEIGDIAARIREERRQTADA